MSKKAIVCVSFGSSYENTVEKTIKKIEEDFEMNLIYYLFSEKNITPMQYYNMPEGEKIMIRAMFIKNMEMRSKIG